MQTTQLIILVLATTANVSFSWRSLKKPRSHGFYRFFVFQSIVALIALNLPYWFTKLFSLQQLISWTLLLISIVYAAAGFYYLIKLGKPKSSARVDGTYSFENTGALVESGCYRFIRHPLYGSLLFLAWGTFLKKIEPSSVLCVLIATLFVILTAKVEEAENIKSFGSDYEKYMKHTKRFIPFIL